MCKNLPNLGIFWIYFFLCGDMTPGAPGWLLFPLTASSIKPCLLSSMICVDPGKQNHYDIFSVNCLSVAAKQSRAFQLLAVFWWESSDVILVVLTERTSVRPQHLLPASPFSLSQSDTLSSQSRSLWLINTFPLYSAARLMTKYY